MKTNKRLERNEIASSLTSFAPRNDGFFVIARKMLRDRHCEEAVVSFYADEAIPKARLLRSCLGFASQSLAMTTSLTMAVIIVFCAIAFLPEQAFAGASVTVSSGSWAIGTKKASAATTSSSFTVTNAASGGTEDITISVGNSTSGWTPAAAAGSNQFVLRMTNVSGQVITATPYTLFTGLANNATSSAFTLYFVTPSSVTAGEGVGQTITVTLTATNWVAVFPCGTDLVKTHTAGTVAPVTKTVTYGTVSFISKCWITKNLGATNQAAVWNDATEASAGWYWQFNRAQGFKHDGTTRTPTTAWIGSINESSNWISANDPCALLLGTGWRLPTASEWNSACINGGWSAEADVYNSILKIHCAGSIYSGGLSNVGLSGAYACFTDSEPSYGVYFRDYYDGESGVQPMPLEKSLAGTVRCIRD